MLQERERKSVLIDFVFSLLRYQEIKISNWLVISFPILFPRKKWKKLKSFYFQLEWNGTELFPIRWQNISNAHVHKIFPFCTVQVYLILVFLFFLKLFIFNLILCVLGTLTYPFDYLSRNYPLRLIKTQQMFV